MKKQKILIVDDNPKNRAICEEIFREDYELLQAEDGTEALQLARSAHPDVVLLDVMMPGMSGYEVCQIMKSDPETERIPVIIVSAKGQTNEIIEGFESRADDYIVKPFINSELRARVRASLRLKQAQDDLRGANDALQEQTRKLGEANERLKELDRIKAGFTAMLVHDLRSPLSVVQLTLQMLQHDQVLLRSEYRPLIQESLASCNDLFELTNDLMEIFRSESTTMQLSKSTASVDRLLREPLNQATLLAERKGVLIRCHVAENLPSMKVDVSKMHRAISNLLSNAVKFTHRGGKIEVRVQLADTGQPADSLFIEVVDSGEGIPPQDLPHIFDPYYQATKNSGIGSGLGLAIVKRVIRAHGGRVMATSQVGQGSRFSVYLPLTEASAAQSGSAKNFSRDS